MTKHKKKHWKWTKSAWAKKLFSFFRWLHIYLSTATFSLLIFFSISGFTLNHTEWFDTKGHQGIETVMVSPLLQSALSDQTTPSVEVIIAYIKTEYGLHQPKSIDMDLELGEINLDYPIPSGYVFITLFTKSGEMEIEHQTGSLISLVNDLHKGRHSGGTWSLVIDISAWIIILFALAGLIILLQHRKRRLSGLLTVFAGTFSPILIYLLSVPSFA